MIIYWAFVAGLKLSEFAIGFMPDFDESISPWSPWAVDFALLITQAFNFFPFDVWFIVMGNIFFWITLHLVWSFFFFFYERIPFI